MVFRSVSDFSYLNHELCPPPVWNDLTLCPVRSPPVFICVAFMQISCLHPCCAEGCWAPSKCWNIWRQSVWFATQQHKLWTSRIYIYIYHHIARPRWRRFQICRPRRWLIFFFFFKTWLSTFYLLHAGPPDRSCPGRGLTLIFQLHLPKGFEI